MNTVLSIQGDRFFLNGHLSYSEIPDSPCQGLLMNARFIQGIFDDKADPRRFDRFGLTFDPEKNTDDLIAALPQWYEAGLRAFTVGFQGGGPCFSMDSNTIINHPFSEDGTAIDPAYLGRMERLLHAADRLGMVVIVSFFYMAQSRFFKSDEAVKNAVATASRWLKETGLRNIIIEVENEYDIEGFPRPDCLLKPEGIIELIGIARKESGGLPCGCSETGGHFTPEVAAASDVILIHGNSLSPAQFYELIKKAKAITPARPIVCNEDSPAISRLAVAVREGVSWGYYNDLPLQELPTDWTIGNEELRCFADRLAITCGIKKEPEGRTRVALQGLSANEGVDGKHWLRLAALYPEQIEWVEYFRGDDLLYRSYDEPFPVNYRTTWLYAPVTDVVPGEVFTVVVHFRDGEILTLKETAK